ncbi:MAG TPA: tetratricopeptide repeat protein, partial [Labilithrix sp.]
MKRSCLALLALGVVLGGCSEKKEADKKEPAPVATARAESTDSDASLSPDEKLALQKLSGTTPSDKNVSDAQTVVRAAMTREDPWIVLGRSWVRKARESADPGFYLNADACARIVLAKNPDNAPALDLQGLVLMNGHKFAEAVALATRVTEKHAEDPMAWGTLSDALLELGRYDDATAAAQRMIDLKPNLPSYSRASYLQWLRGDDASAKLTVRAALDSGRDAKRDPEPGAWVLVQAAMIFWHEGDYEGAEAGFDKALERISDYAPANVGKGRCAMARGDYRRAAELFARAHAQSPLVETAWLLGDAREAAGDTKGAAEAFARVEKDGKKTDPRTLALFWATKGTHTDEAVALADEELRIRQDIYSEDAVAWSLYRAGRLEDAKEHVTRARRLGTPDARLMYHEGAIRLATGDAKGR